MFSRFSLFVFMFVAHLSFGVSAVLASGEVGWGATPDFVVETDIPSPVQEHLEEISNGVYYLLVSRQNRFDGKIRREYGRYVSTVTNRQGLERQSSISVVYRPNFEKLTFHKIAIHRGDDLIDFTGDLEFSVFRQEHELDNGILDGKLTAFVNVPRVRIGDTIEFAYSREYSSIPMSDQYFTGYQNTYDNPISMVETVIQVPETMALSYKSINAVTEPEISVNDGYVKYRWVSSAVSAAPETKNRPHWYSANELLFVSSVESWADVAQEVLSYYPSDAELPEELKSELAAIKESTDDRKRWISDVLKLVQREIRYVGVEIDSGAFIPRDPQTVFRLGYGDCKDKTYLMVTALRWIGIEAVPALVNLEVGRQIAERLPSPYAFDHIIVRATLDDEVYWLDPTATYQFSPDPAYSQADYGVALPVSAEAQGLEEIRPLDLYQPLTTVSETLTLGYGEKTPPLPIDVVSQFLGADADGFRRQLASNGLGWLRSRYLDYYDSMYGDVEEAKKIRIADDTEANRIVVTEKYVRRSRDGLDELLKEFPLTGDAVRSELWEADDRYGNPVKLDFPMFKQHRVTVRNLRIQLAPLDGVWIARPYLDFSLDSSSEGHDLSVTWRLRSKRDHVLPSEVSAYQDVVSRVDKDTGWFYDVRPPKEEEQDVVSE